ncbi:MAG: conjugal transfer protein TraG [Brachymonas sp.]|nr:conjugal transfer protein TraG [Brachymonas sp.]
MINLLKNRELRTAVNSGNTALAMTELAAVQAEQQRMNSYLQSARAAQDTIPAIRNILEAVAIGLFPPLLIVMVLAGMMGLKLMMEWAMFFLSLQLWGFCYAIMNMVMINKTANNVYANTLSADVPFYALNNVSAIAEEAAADLAMAGSMAWAIPIICYGLTKGVGMAMGSMASSLAGPAKSTAESTGAGAGLGSTRQGEVRMNQASIGNTAQIGGAGGTSTMFMGDTGFRAQSPHLAAFQGFSSSAAGVSANLGQAVGQAAQVQAGLAKDAARESSVAASKEQTAALAETISSATKRSDTASVGKGWDSSTNGSYETGSSGLQSLMSQVKKSTGASDSEAASIVAGAKVNAGPSIAGFGAQLTSSIDKQYGSKAAREFSSAQGADTSKSIADAHRMVSALSSSSQAREAVTGGTEQSKATEGRFQRADSLRSQEQAKLSESQKWSDVASRSASNSAQVGQDLLASDPAAASRIAAVAASPEYQSRKAAGDHIGAGQMLDRALRAEGLTPDKMLQQISSQPSVSTAPLTTSGGQTVDSSSASSQFSSDSNQVNQRGQAAVSSTRSQAPKVNTSRPNTSRMASSVNDGLGAVGGTIEASEKALRQESATQQGDVENNVPQSKSDGSFAAREGQASGALGRAADGATDTASRVGAGTIDNLPKPILTDFINKK